MRKPLLAALAVMLVASLPADASVPGWSALDATGGPGGRRDHALTFDAARGVLVLFGGARPGGLSMGDLWEWDGTRWSARSPAGPAPVARSGAAIAYDPLRAETVLFGGYARIRSARTGRLEEVWLDDTWAWDGTRWTLRAAGTGPSPRTGAAMAFDPGQGRVLLHGGTDPRCACDFDDAWAWDGTRWDPAYAPPLRPAGRSGHLLVHDPARREMVLFGGEKHGLPATDTWVRTSRDWLVRGVSGPSPRWGAAGTAAWGKVWVHGGTLAGNTRSDLWEWDGARWTQVLETGPLAVSGHAMAFDPVAGRILVFGGCTAVCRDDAFYAITR